MTVSWLCIFFKYYLPTRKKNGGFFLFWIIAVDVPCSNTFITSLTMHRLECNPNLRSMNRFLIKKGGLGAGMEVGQLAGSVESFPLSPRFPSYLGKSFVLSDSVSSSTKWNGDTCHVESYRLKILWESWATASIIHLCIEDKEAVKPNKYICMLRW